MQTRHGGDGSGGSPKLPPYGYFFLIDADNFIPLYGDFQPNHKFPRYQGAVVSSVIPLVHNVEVPGNIDVGSVGLEDI